VAGSADVTITNGTFKGNKQKAYPGAALVVAGKASVKVKYSFFKENKAEEQGNSAGMCATLPKTCLNSYQAGWPANYAYSTHFP